MQELLEMIKKLAFLCFACHCPCLVRGCIEEIAGLDRIMISADILLWAILFRANCDGILY
jgi:hypothetical protein